MKTRLKHLASTIPGFILLVAGIFLISIGKITATEFTGFAVIGAWLIGYKPPKNPTAAPRNLFTIFLLATFSFLLTSCTPAQRLARLEKYHPELFKTDSLIIIDTITIPEIKVDTVVSWNTLHTTDTITLTKENLQVKIIKVGDTLKIQGTQKADTVYLTKIIPYTKYKSAKEKPTVKKYLIAAGCGFFLCVLFYSIIFIRRK